MASLSGVYNLQILDSAGELAAGHRLYTYTAGTTTHKAAYTEATGSTAHTYTSDGIGGQYIALDARGELPAPLFLATGNYDLTLKTSAGSTVWTRRAVPVSDSAAALDTALRADFADSGSGKGDSLLAVKQSVSGSSATTQHQVNEDRDSYIGASSDYQILSTASSNAGKRRLAFAAGTYAMSAVTVSQTQQHIRGMGWTSDETTTPAAIITKSANGTHLTLSGDDASLSDVHLDGLTASFSGDGLVVTGTRSKLDGVSIAKQRGVSLRLGGNAVNGNLWSAFRPIALAGVGDLCYIHHTGGSVTGTYPAGIPDINAGNMWGGDFRRGSARGLVLENTIDNCFYGVAVQECTGKGVVLKSGARGHKFFGLYSEGNNGSGGGAGDEVDIESGATENLIIGLRSNQTTFAGLRDVNTAGKNLFIHYDAGVGSWVHRAKFCLWNPLQDGSTTADSECWVGTTPVNTYTLKGSVSGTSGGILDVFTKIDGGAVTSRHRYLANGDQIFQNATNGWNFGKTAFDTTTTGVTIEATAGRLDIVNSGAGSKTVLAFYDASGAAGSITTNGSGTAAYNTTSDYRLKRDIIDADKAAAMQAVLSWPIRQFTRIAGGATEIGVIAHELQAVEPSAVTGEKDAMEVRDGVESILPQGVDYSKLVAKMAAALQFANEQITALRDRVAALENA
jgi:Chaperone of endosialidase